MQRTEDRGQKTEDRRQKTEDRRQKTPRAGTPSIAHKLQKVYSKDTYPDDDAQASRQDIKWCLKGRS